MRWALIGLCVAATYLQVYTTMRRWHTFPTPTKRVQVTFAALLVWVAYGVNESMRADVPIQSRVFYGLVVLSCLVVFLALDYKAKRRQPTEPSIMD